MRGVVVVSLISMAIGCSRSKSEPPAAPIVDASVAPSAIEDASIAPAFDAGVTLAAYCQQLTAWDESPEGIVCRGEKTRPTCDVQEKKKLPTIGKIVLVDERVFEGTHAMLLLVDASGHFATLDRIQTEVCDMGDPADVSLELVSANETADAGFPIATIVFDSLRDDPPFQGGSRIQSATRYSIRCHASLGLPACDEPATLGSFTGSTASGKPPPFSQWKKGK